MFWVFINILGGTCLRHRHIHAIMFMFFDFINMRIPHEF